MAIKLLSSDDCTVVDDIDISGRRRSVAVSREAIGHYLRLMPEQAAELDKTARYNFVRNNLPLVIRAAKRKLEAMFELADVIIIRSGEL